MRRRMTSLIVATVCGVTWSGPQFGPSSALAAASHASRSRADQPPPPPVSPSPNASAPQEAQPEALPPTPCSAWSEDPAVLVPAPTVCRNYISGQGNSALELEEPILSKVPQDPELIEEFAGVRGDTATKEFTVEEPWRVEIESDSDFLIGEFRYGPMRREKVMRLPKFNEPGIKRKSFDKPGTYYLNVRADGTWRARIILQSRTYQYDYDIAARSRLTNPTPLPVLITYSFGEGKRHEITLGPGQSQPIEGNIALSDYTEPRSAEQLREDFPGLLIHNVENVSEASVQKRKAIQQKARKAKLDPKRTRQAARSELQHTAIGVHARNKEQRQKDERSLTAQAEAKDKRWKRRWGTAGVITMIAGAGAGTALMVLGGTQLPEAKDNLNAAKAKRAAMGDAPSPNIILEIGRYTKDVQNAEGQLTAGIIIAAVGVVAGTALLVVANRTPSKRQARREGVALKVSPWLSPGRWGAGASLRF